MKKKYFVVFACSLLWLESLRSQNLSHSLGLSFGSLAGNEKIGNSTSPFTFTLIHATYYPRTYLSSTENSSITLGIPIGVGIGVSSNTGVEQKGIGLYYDLPVAIDYNFGAGSTNGNSAIYGGFIGAGFGYNKVNSTQTAYQGFTGDSYGPIARFGGRFGSREDELNGHTVAIGATIKKGMESQGYTNMGISILIDF